MLKSQGTDFIFFFSSPLFSRGESLTRTVLLVSLQAARAP